jgi:hypothetical protein
LLAQASWICSLCADGIIKEVEDVLASRLAFWMYVEGSDGLGDKLPDDIVMGVLGELKFVLEGMMVSLLSFSNT